MLDINYVTKQERLNSNLLLWIRTKPLHQKRKLIINLRTTVNNYSRSTYALNYCYTATWITARSVQTINKVQAKDLTNLLKIDLACNRTSKHLTLQQKSTQNRQTRTNWTRRLWISDIFWKDISLISVHYASSNQDCEYWKPQFSELRI